MKKNLTRLLGAGVGLAMVAAAPILLGGSEPPASHADRPAPPAPKPAAPSRPEPAKAVEKVGAKPAGLAAQSPAPKPAAPADAERAVTPEEAMKLLQDGNTRWTNNSPQNPNLDPARRKSLAENGQRPVATILTCADSRVPVERLFDRGVGDLFVLRVAGNITGEHEAGSIEYAAEHLRVPLLVILGHTRCGAVGAAASRAPTEGNIPSLVKAIDPAVARAQKLNPSLKDKDLIAAAIKENVWQSITDLLRTSTLSRDLVAGGQLKVVGAVYDISTGQVEWMGEHPWQGELVAAFSTRGAKTATAGEAAGH